MTTALSLEARGIQKAFPGVLALQDVAITMRGGSIHALLGENGAGKSTLIKIITGVHRPDEGELLLERRARPLRRSARGDRRRRRRRPSGAQPHSALFGRREHPARAARRRSRCAPIDYDAVHAEARRWLDVLELDLDPRTPVSQLNVAKVQLVEIAKALSLRSRVLLLDEPTASLTPQETDVLFRLLRKLRDEGASLLFVSHKLEEVQEICDEVTVLRDGRNACPSRPMAGLGAAGPRAPDDRPQRADPRLGAARSLEGAETMLELKSVSTALGHAERQSRRPQGRDRRPLRPRRRGPHRTRQMHSRAASRFTKANVTVAGQAERIASVADAIHRCGIGYISEDRKQEGLIICPYRARKRRHHRLAQARRAARPAARRSACARACRPGHRQARGAHALARANRRQSLGRQSAEDQRRQMAGGGRAAS